MTASHDVYFGGLAAEAAILLRDLRAAGSDAVLVASDAIVAPAFAGLDPALASGTLMTAQTGSVGNAAATTIAGAILAEAAAARGRGGVGRGDRGRAAAAPPRPRRRRSCRILSAEGVIENSPPGGAERLRRARSLRRGGERRRPRRRGHRRTPARGPRPTPCSGRSRSTTAGDVVGSMTSVYEWREGPLGGLDYLGNPAR